MIQAISSVNTLIDSLADYSFKSDTRSGEAVARNNATNQDNNKNRNANKANENLVTKSEARVSYANFVESLQLSLKESNLSLEFSKDEDSSKMIMKIINSETQEVIRQFPEEISLKIARVLSKTMENRHITNVVV